MIQLHVQSPHICLLRSNPVLSCPVRSGPFYFLSFIVNQLHYILNAAPRRIASSHHIFAAL